MFKNLLSKNVPKEFDLMTGRFMFSTKDCETDSNVRKAQFFVHGHTDTEKHMSIHASKLKEADFANLIAVTVIRRVMARSWDVAQADLQGDSHLRRDIH